MPNGLLKAVHAKQNVGPGNHISHAATSQSAAPDTKPQQYKMAAVKGLKHMPLQSAATDSNDKQGDTVRHVRSDKSAKRHAQAVSAEALSQRLIDGERQQAPDVCRRSDKHLLSMQSLSASPNSCLAKSGRAASHSSPAAKLGYTAALRSSSPSRVRQQPRSSHVIRSGAEPALHDTAAARKGQASSSAAGPVQDKAKAAQPSFIQTLRDWGLGPTSSGPLTQPMWQPYNRHVTPDRDSSRSALARRALAEKAQALQRLNESSAAGLSSGLAARTQQPRVKLSTHQAHSPAQTREVRHPENWDSTVRGSIAAWSDNVPLSCHQRISGRRSAHDSHTHNRPAPTSRSVGGPASVANTGNNNIAECQSPTNHGTQGALLHPCPLKPSVGRLWGRSSSPTASQLKVSQSPVSPPSGEMKKTQNRAMSVQSGAKPYRAGQLASAALQTKQDAWEHTRMHRLPSLLSQVTELLCCNSEPVLLVPERSATELMCAAAPQLGQQTPLPATAAGWGSHPAEHLVEEGTTAAALHAAEDQEEEDATAVAEFGQEAQTWDIEAESPGHMLPGKAGLHVGNGLLCTL